MRFAWSDSIGIRICLSLLAVFLAWETMPGVFAILYGVMLTLLYRNRKLLASDLLRDRSALAVLIGATGTVGLQVLERLGMFHSTAYLDASIPLFLIAIPALVFLDPPSPRPQRSSDQSVAWLALLGILIAAFLLRIIDLGELSIWWDEIYAAESVKNILEQGIPKGPQDATAYWRGVAYHYLLSFFALFGGWNEFSLRLPGVLFSIGILAWIIWLARSVSLALAVATGIFLAFSPYSVETARFARFYIMNAFLFLLAANCAYRGFYQQQTGYKVLFLLTGFVMMHTVQIGAFFVFLLGAYFGERLLLMHEPISKRIERLAKDAHYLILSAAIVLAGNVIEKLFGRPLEYLYTDAPAISDPRHWKFIDWPDPEILLFFQAYYLPLLLFLVGILYGLRDRDERIRFYAFATALSLLFFMILNRNTNGARIFYLWEPLYVFFSFFGVYLFLQNHRFLRLPAGIVTIVLSFVFVATIQPSAYSVITRSYGDDVTDDPFRSTTVSTFRSDEKTPYQFLNDRLDPQDIWISVKYDKHPYVDRLPDYIFDQNVRWNTFAVAIDPQGYFVNADGVRLINTVADIENILGQSQRRDVWISVRGSSIDVLHTQHVRQEFYEFLDRHRKSIVYRSADRRSIVLYFPGTAG